MTSHRSATLIAITVGLFTVLGLGHVWVRMQVISLGYELSRETRARHELTEQNQRLRLELTSRIDPATIEKIAHQELHMTAPEPQRIHVIRADGGQHTVARAPRKP